MGKMHFQVAVVAFAFACLTAGAAGAAASRDAQGWGGPGWYVTGSAPPEPSSTAPDYILLEGPHKLQSDCLKVYNQLYSPIGACRFLDVKPVPFAERIR
jgi:hypothetical protein